MNQSIPSNDLRGFSADTIRRRRATNEYDYFARVSGVIRHADGVLELPENNFCGRCGHHQTNHYSAIHDPNGICKSKTCLCVGFTTKSFS